MLNDSKTSKFVIVLYKINYLTGIQFNFFLVSLIYFKNLLMLLCNYIMPVKREMEFLNHIIQRS